MNNSMIVSGSTLNGGGGGRNLSCLLDSGKDAFGSDIGSEEKIGSTMVMMNHQGGNADASRLSQMQTEAEFELKQTLGS